jgi:hypothetical protein
MMIYADFHENRLVIQNGFESLRSLHSFSSRFAPIDLPSPKVLMAMDILCPQPRLMAKWVEYMTIT